MSYDEIWFEKTLVGVQGDWVLLSTSEVPTPINSELNAHNSSFMLRSAIKAIDPHIDDRHDVAIYSHISNRDGRTYLAFDMRVPTYLRSKLKCLQVRSDRLGQVFFKFKSETTC